jgi:hypothetical protein
LTGKTYAQSEPDIISAFAARAAKWGIAANGRNPRSSFALALVRPVVCNFIEQLRLWSANTLDAPTKIVDIFNMLHL